MGMITALKNMLSQIDRWPSDDQEALLEAARSIEAERTGTYRASEAELAAIDRGLDDARAGRFASDDAVAEVRAKVPW
jgi:predicted transcriptional regulator